MIRLDFEWTNMLYEITVCYNSSHTLDMPGVRRRHVRNALPVHFVRLVYVDICHCRSVRAPRAFGLK